MAARGTRIASGAVRAVRSARPTPPRSPPAAGSPAGPLIGSPIIGRMPDRIDLRSDTVTLPSPPMRRAMADAEVGDDQYGEDPPSTGSRRRSRSCSAPRQRSSCRADHDQPGRAAHPDPPGDDVLVPVESHVVLHETGAGAANAGVQFSPIGSGGLFDADAVRAAIKPPGHIVYPPTTLLVTENTHNRAGGIVFPTDLLARGACRRARARARHLPRRCADSQRGRGQRAPSADLARGFDLVVSRSARVSAPPPARCWQAHAT